MSTMTSTEEAVRAWAEGLYPTEAGVELLIRTGRIYEGAPWVIADGDRAWVDVDRLIEHTGGLSGGERRASYRGVQISRSVRLGAVLAPDAARSGRVAGASATQFRLA